MQRSQSLSRASVLPHPLLTAPSIAPSSSFSRLGGCYRPPHCCAPMNFNSSRRIPGKGTPQIYFFLFFFSFSPSFFLSFFLYFFLPSLFRTARRNKENEGRRRRKREWFNRWRWRTFSIVSGLFPSLSRIDPRGFVLFFFSFSFFRFVDRYRWSRAKREMAIAYEIGRANCYTVLKMDWKVLNWMDEFFIRRLEMQLNRILRIIKNN